MRTKLLVLLSIVSISVFAQFNVKDIDSTQIHKGIKLKKNKVVSSIMWFDKAGENYVIQTATPLIATKSALEAKKNYELVRTDGKFVNSKKVNGKMVRGEYVGGKVDTIWSAESEYRIKGLFTYHYLIDKTDTLRLLWKNIDQMSQCSYKYLQANYLTKPMLTDLDKDGKAEVWFVYELGCTDNKTASPMVMKLALYIGKKAYMIKGRKVVQNGDKMEGGEILPDKSYDELPQVFRDHALKIWNTYKFQK